MKIEITSADEAKAFATRLRALCLSKSKLTLPVGHSLEVVSALFGHKNWDTMCGALSQVAPPHQAPPLTLATPITLYIQGMADRTGPTWAKIEVCQEYLDMLINFALSAKVSHLQHNTSHLVREEGPHAWDEEDTYRPVDDRLVMYSEGTFYHEAYGKHSNARYETIPLPVCGLVSMLREAVAAGKSYILHADRRECLDDLKADLDAADELCFCRSCEEAYAPGGDGYDGECPSCADKSSQKGQSS